MLSCNRNTDKKAELEKLKKEHDVISEKILELEKELASEGGDKRKEVNVAVTEVKPTVFKHYIEVQGKVDGDENVAVSARSAGVVISVNVQEGQKVSKGQLMAILDAQVLYASLADMESQLVFVTDIFNRQKNLWEQNIGSEIQYLTAKNNKESLENKIKTLKDQISMSRITSPIDGTVEEINIKIGQSVAPGLPAFRVVNFNKIKVVADVAEAYSPKIKTNDSVLIYFPDFNEEISSKLNFTSKYINAMNRTFMVESQIKSPKHEMRANMIAVLKINDYKAVDAVAIPVNLVQKALNDHFVYVAVEEKGKKFSMKRIVTLGRNYNGMVEIISGLKPGDLLITTGYQDLFENSPIIY